MQCGRFALKDGNASGGVEQYYNDILNGVSGREYGYLNGDSNVERTVKPAQNGKTLELTIDVNIQKIVQKYLDEWQAGIGSNLAAAIVMDPNSGEILAMDTTTRYNLNDPYNLSTYYTDEEIQEIQAAADNACQEVSALVSEGADDYEKAKAVYTYLIDTAEYQESEDDQSMAGIFWRKQAVCAGYAGAAQYLLEYLGVPCIYVEGSTAGSTEGHAWNNLSTLNGND